MGAQCSNTAFTRNSATSPQGDVNRSSPIQAIPPELLYEIFHHCTTHPKEPSGLYRLPRPSIAEAPLKLGRICRWWRTLLHSNPSLWSQLSLGSEWDEGRNHSLDLKVLDEWLTRSQQAPLWLSIRYSITSSDVDRVIAKIIPHYYRWQYLELQLPSACAQPIVAKVSAFTTILQNLQIIILDSDYTGDKTLTIDLSRQSALTDLTFDIGTQFVHGHGAMNNIRTLQMSFPTINNYFHCLDLCPSVEDVYFYFDITIDFQASVSQTLHILPSIRILSLAVFNTEYHEVLDIGPFLDRLQLPSLNTFEFDPPYFMEQLERWTHISSLLQRSSPPLECFKVGGGIPMDEICECLRKAPGLEVVQGGSGLFANPMLDTLTERFACPKLRHIELDGRHHADCEVAAELVLRRWYGRETDANPSRIRTVILLNISEDFQVDPFLYYPGILECIRDGLSVTSSDTELHNTVYTYNHSKFSSEQMAKRKLWRATKNPMIR